MDAVWNEPALAVQHFALDLDPDAIELFVKQALVPHFSEFGVVFFF